MRLWDWVTEFRVQAIATTATTATEEGSQGRLSQLSQLSQGAGVARDAHENEQLSQLSQLSQPVADCAASAESARAARDGTANPASVRVVWCSGCKHWTPDPMGGGGVGACAVGADARSRSAVDGRALSAWPHARRVCAEWEGQGATGERFTEEPEEAAQLFEDFISDKREALEERAAIMEYDGGLSREEAERLASGGAAQTVWRGDALDLGDLRPCLWCRNLARNGQCISAMRGELRAARDYSPALPGLPRRCIAYSPPADDPDRRPGRERWPELIESQGTGTARP